MILDTDFIQQRCRDLGMTGRTLATELGVTYQVVAALEEGSNHQVLPLSLIQALADRLAVDIRCLFPEEARENSGSADDLVRSVGALLLEAGSLVAVEALAETHAVTIAEIETALRSLEARTEQVGFTIYRLGGDVTIRPATAKDQTARKDLLRWHQARRGLKLGEARILHRLITDGIDEGKLGNADRVSLNRLRNAGIATNGRDPTVTKDVVVGMLLEGQP